MHLNRGNSFAAQHEQQCNVYTLYTPHILYVEEIQVLVQVLVLAACSMATITCLINFLL